MSEKKALNSDLEKVCGGTDMTYEEILEHARNNLPEGNVTCKNPLCGKQFNARDNAIGFGNITYPETGMTVTFAQSKCPFCHYLWNP